MPKQPQQQNPNLTDEQKAVLLGKGTEAPGTGAYLNHTESGMYTCANCGATLFSSDAKYDSKTPGLIGWPSFSDPATNDAVELRDDNDLGVHRTEVVCKNCGGHLGHVFDADDAPDGGKHYCINSVCLGFMPKESR
jgi:peptide-methionine (R)-S-oxide reductase